MFTIIILLFDHNVKLIVEGINIRGVIGSRGGGERFQGKCILVSFLIGLVLKRFYEDYSYGKLSSYACVYLIKVKFNCTEACWEVKKANAEGGWLIGGEEDLAHL